MESLVASFARDLGASPGLNPPKTQLPTYNVLRAITDPVENLTEEDTYEFNARFAAEYLPSTYKIISETSVAPDTLENTMRLAILIAKPSSFYDRRFVREHGEEALAYFVALLRIVYRLPDSLLELSTEVEKELMNDVVVTLARALALRFGDLLVAYPGSSLPVPPRSDDQLLALPRLARFIETNSTLDLSEREKTQFLDLLHCQFEAINLDFVRKGANPEGNPRRWDPCEWFQDERRVEGDVICVEVKDGEELQACGRCHTVRYCSKKHQKLHWKMHKRECFKASW